MTGGSRISRRGFVGLAATGGAGLLAGGWFFGRGMFSRPPVAPRRGPPWRRRPLGPDEQPIRAIDDVRQTSFTGDDFTRPHEFLWQRDASLRAAGDPPEPGERANVVVVGGGVSGLCSAYLLRDLRPVLLEQGAQLGGNSRGERWGSLEYSIGAAYIGPPEPGDDVDLFLRELGIAGEMRRSEPNEEGSYVRDGAVHAGFWDGASDPARADEFRRVYARLSRYYDDEYLEIPPAPEDASELRRLDAIAFDAWVARELGTLHPHVAEALDLYAWSTYGGTVSEVSAAQMLYFLASDVRGVAAFPGGNSTITNALVRKLEPVLPRGAIRTGTLVVAVRPHAEGVTVTYADARGTLRTLLAKKCVVACAKFIAKHVVDGIPAAQLAAMRRLTYRAYVVANVLVRRPLPSPAFDCWRLAGARSANASAGTAERPFTDLLFAAWAAHDRADHCALTLYKALPYDGGRGDLFQPDSFARMERVFEGALPEIVSAMGARADDVASVRVTRWGHAIPLAERGLIAEGIAERASAPIDDRIFFSQQDNWCSPAFEPALACARATATALRRSLSR